MRILLAIDGSACSSAAIAEVGRRPWPSETEVRIVSVNAPVDTGFVKHGSLTVFDEIAKEQRTELARCLHDAATVLAKSAPELRVTTELLEGCPKDAIVSEAERWGADLVVVGSHGYGPIRRFFLGSVSLYVAHHAPCSVQIVRPPTR